MTCLVFEGPWQSECMNVQTEFRAILAYQKCLGCGIFSIYIIICRYIPYMYMVSHKRVRAPHLFSNMGTAMSNGHVDLARKLLHLRRVGSSSYVQ